MNLIYRNRTASILLLSLLLGINGSLFADSWEPKSGFSSLTDDPWYSLVVQGSVLGMQTQPRNQPALAVSCYEQDNTVAILSPWRIEPSVGQSDKQRIKVRYDHETVKEELWFVDDDRRTLIAPNPSEQALLLSHSETLRVELTAWDLGRRVIELPVAGFDPDRGNLSLHCYWPELVTDLIVVTGESPKPCSLRSPDFSDFRKGYPKERFLKPFDLIIRAEVGPDGRLDHPKIQSQEKGPTKPILQRLERAVRLSQCENAPMGDFIDIRYRYPDTP